MISFLVDPQKFHSKSRIRTRARITVAMEYANTDRAVSMTTLYNQIHLHPEQKINLPTVAQQAWKELEQLGVEAEARRQFSSRNKFSTQIVACQISITKGDVISLNFIFVFLVLFFFFLMNCFCPNCHKLFREWHFFKFKYPGNPAKTGCVNYGSLYSGHFYRVYQYKWNWYILVPF